MKVLAKFIIHISCLLFFLNSSIGQPNFLEDGEVFRDEVVPRVDIYINPDTLDWIYENVDSYQEFHAVFIFNNGNIADTIENIGFRLRGNTSRYSAKKSFKVSFNTFEPGRKWYGLEKINLNGEHNDPSIIRSKLCWDLLRDFEIPGARSNHVRIYINDNYYGLYINVEHIDEEFVKSRFGNNDGNLYKCLWPADLDYLGSNPENYKVTVGDRRVYDLKTNTELDDYSDLAHFINVLNNTPDAQFLCEIEKIFNVYDYLKIIAIDIFTGNWDGYIYNQNNFYLYHNTATSKFEYIPYDLDNTYGIDWIGRDWGNRNIYDWQQHGNNVRPLYTRIMENQQLKDQFSFYMGILNNELTEPTPYFLKIDAIRDQIGQYVFSDPYYPLDYGYTITDFYNSYEEGIGGHVPYGIKPYISTRRFYSALQLESNDMIPVIKYINNTQPMVGEDLFIRAYVEDEDPYPQVKIIYSLNNGQPQIKYMYDDGEHQDGEAGGKMYGGIFMNIQINTSLSYQVSAEDNFGKVQILPCEPVLIEIMESDNPQLFINEFMASNDSTIADEYGEYDDWIEIYNGDENPVWLGDKYLSDNLLNFDKWQLPDVTLQSGEFILIWADNDPEQGPNHTNFKLDQNGEEIGIFDAEITGFFLIDSISYCEQTTDISLGRNPDAGNDWIYYLHATPGYSNLLGNIENELAHRERIIVFPNPVTSGRVNFDQYINIHLYNGSGQLILRNKNVNSLQVDELESGIYFIVTDDKYGIKLLIK